MLLLESLAQTFTRRAEAGADPFVPCFVRRQVQSSSHEVSVRRQFAEQDGVCGHRVDGQRNDHRPPRLNGFWSVGRVTLNAAVLAPWPNVAVKLVGPVFCFFA